MQTETMNVWDTEHKIYGLSGIHKQVSEVCVCVCVCVGRGCQAQL